MTGREGAGQWALGSRKLRSRTADPPVFGGTSREEAGLFLHDSLSHPKLPWKRAAPVPALPQKPAAAPRGGHRPPLETLPRGVPGSAE